MHAAKIRSESLGNSSHFQKESNKARVYLQSLGNFGDAGGDGGEAAEAAVDGAALADAPLGAHLGDSPGAAARLARSRTQRQENTRTHRDQPDQHRECQVIIHFGTLSQEILSLAFALS